MSGCISGWPQYSKDSVDRGASQVWATNNNVESIYWSIGWTARPVVRAWWTIGVYEEWKGRYIFMQSLYLFQRVKRRLYASDQLGSPISNLFIDNPAFCPRCPSWVSWKIVTSYQHHESRSHNTELCQTSPSPAIQSPDLTNNVLSRSSSQSSGVSDQAPQCLYSQLMHHNHPLTSLKPP